MDEVTISWSEIHSEYKLRCEWLVVVSVVVNNGLYGVVEVSADLLAR